MDGQSVRRREEHKIIYSQILIYEFIVYMGLSETVAMKMARGDRRGLNNVAHCRSAALLTHWTQDNKNNNSFAHTVTPPKFFGKTNNNTKQPTAAAS